MIPALDRSVRPHERQYSIRIRRGSIELPTLEFGLMLLRGVPRCGLLALLACVILGVAPGFGGPQAALTQLVAASPGRQEVPTLLVGGRTLEAIFSEIEGTYASTHEGEFPAYSAPREARTRVARCQPCAGTGYLPSPPGPCGPCNGRGQTESTDFVPYLMAAGYQSALLRRIQLLASLDPVSSSDLGPYCARLLRLLLHPHDSTGPGGWALAGQVLRLLAKVGDLAVDAALAEAPRVEHPFGQLRILQALGASGRRRLPASIATQWMRTEHWDLALAALNQVDPESEGRCAVVPIARELLDLRGAKLESSARLLQQFGDSATIRWTDEGLILARMTQASEYEFHPLRVRESLLHSLPVIQGCDGFDSILGSVAGCLMDVDPALRAATLASIEATFPDPNSAPAMFEPYFDVALRQAVDARAWELVPRLAKWIRSAKRLSELAVPALDRTPSDVACALAWCEVLQDRQPLASDVLERLARILELRGLGAARGKAALAMAHGVAIEDHAGRATVLGALVEAAGTLDVTADCLRAASSLSIDTQGHARELLLAASAASESAIEQLKTSTRGYGQSELFPRDLPVGDIPGIMRAVDDQAVSMLVGLRVSLAEVRPLLRHESAFVRRWAALAIGRLGAEGLPALPDLIGLFSDKSLAPVEWTADLHILNEPGWWTTGAQRPAERPIGKRLQGDGGQGRFKAWIVREAALQAVLALGCEARLVLADYPPPEMVVEAQDLVSENRIEGRYVQGPRVWFEAAARELHEKCAPGQPFRLGRACRGGDRVQITFIKIEESTGSEAGDRRRAATADRHARAGRLGTKELPEALDRALVGLTVGESKRVKVTANAQFWGERSSRSRRAASSSTHTVEVRLEAIESP